jgi:hypothetical protein
MSIVFESEGGG